MGQKRGNDKSQLTKEDNDYLESKEVETKYGIQKADEAKMRKRRIISVSGRGKWAKKSTAPSAEAASSKFPTTGAGSSTKSNNAFGAINFTASMPKPIKPSMQPPQPAPTASKSSGSNPFASISFAGNSSKPQFPTVPAPAVNRSFVGSNAPAQRGASDTSHNRYSDHYLTSHLAVNYQPNIE